MEQSIEPPGSELLGQTKPMSAGVGVNGADVGVVDPGDVANLYVVNVCDQFLSERLQSNFS
jgi:hypothetical protein